MEPSYCEKCGAKTCLDGTNIHICIMKSVPVKKTTAYSLGVKEERQRILSLPCMEEEPVEKDSGPIYLKGEFGGDPIPYHQSIKLPIETNIARNAIRREIRDALQSK